MEKQRYERPVIKKLETNMPNKFGTQTELAPKTHIDNVPVKKLIEEFGSPLFVVSEQTIRKTFAKAKKAFTTRYPKVQFAWSYKTNYQNAICNVFHQEGSWAEVVSGFEYEKALRNGVDGKKIIFNGPDKTVDDLKLAIENDSLLHIDHLDELYTIIELAGNGGKKPKVAIRVNMDTGVYPMWDRFGFNYENGQAWDALNKIMRSNKLELVGLHTHIGTFMLSANAYSVAAYKLAELALGIQKKYSHEIKYIDMGGGFASKNTLKGAYMPGTDTNPTFDDFAEAITSALINSDFKPDKLPLLILETGRALIDDAGYLLGTVISNKRLADGKRTTILDIGVNLMFTSFWYDHKVTPAQPFSHYTENTVLYGPLCMNIDVIRENANLPLLNKGEHVVVHSVGAYNMTQWMQFITLRPNIVMIDEKATPHLIREKETLDSLMSYEKVPEHLKKFDL
ncbi:MAG: alanine racemase [Bacteroidales bacterium]|nr:alanine racemase [Bacteroidales bacterium]MCF8344000.1 alanine racemase [Bacteroidales bacterium]MCF8350424.1 alanine racemase [Bacteroidales bacterium]MCF8377675.1 alanine racemase [Bacteroidales bacterium]MCF8401951.1 alanine racemase [Bacteroidales bacterium]